MPDLHLKSRFKDKIEEGIKVAKFYLGKCAPAVGGVVAEAFAVGGSAARRVGGAAREVGGPGSSGYSLGGKRKGEFSHEGDKWHRTSFANYFRRRT